MILKGKKVGVQSAVYHSRLFYRSILYLVTYGLMEDFFKIMPLIADLALSIFQKIHLNEPIQRMNREKIKYILYIVGKVISLAVNSCLYFFIQACWFLLKGKLGRLMNKINAYGKLVVLWWPSNSTKLVFNI